MTPAVLLWSGGKDAALALDALRAGDAFNVVALVTTVAMPGETVTMHGTPLELVRAQADALGLPLHVMRLPKGASNDVYETRLAEALVLLKAEGVQAAAAGDLLLADVRAYREEVLQRLGFEAVFPLWQQDTTRLARYFLEEGYRAVVTSVDTDQLDASFAGRPFDDAFLCDLPASVDPCGENGEFHTFATSGPPFARPVPVTVGPVEGERQMQYVCLRSS